MVAMVLRTTIAEVHVNLGQFELASTYVEGALRDLSTIGDGGRVAGRLDATIRRINEAPTRVDGQQASAKVLLSTRELQVLSLLESGMTLDEIGHSLFVSRNTVKTHVSRTYRKLGAHDRDEAVSTAHRLGLL